MAERNGAGENGIGTGRPPTRMVVALGGYFGTTIEDRLGGRPDLELVTADGDALDEALRDADALLTTGMHYSEKMHHAIREAGPRLRWLHTLTAGNERLEAHGVPDHVVVTRTGGHHAPIVAEHATAMLLALARGLPAAWDAQKEGVWARERSIGSTRSLYQRTAVVLGLGPIGEAIARHLKAFGMTVLGVSRRGRPCDAVDRVYAQDGLLEALARAHVLMIAAPGGPGTEKLIDSQALATLQPRAFVTNIGRGSIIDSLALDAALRSGHIGGAGLDVTDPEPLPEGHPLWTAPNCIITPHRAGSGDPGSADRMLDSIVHNLERFRRGEPLDYVLEL
ncbi:D-2-hydroxyacid dehydrogenase [Sphingobium nicotianae]|uniref:D-2-hydroxyacid dehydrogenase n=1 Tax=Sphingobium nicotianae TaxID=2782607 RepID=A0A9X1AI77_9SPHN|nr:D-2-hydroxyacid dehydrogenase [Sphingobium nicotianae]MBT2185647.1 D-2-hydroxyacid dehydrogenase [Sphingobium nicotianae]